MSSRAMKNLLRDSNGPAPLKEVLDNNSKSTNKENNNRHDQTGAAKDRRSLNDDSNRDVSDNEEDEEEEGEDDYDIKRPPARNLFALLIENDQESDSASEDEEKQPEVLTPVVTTSNKKKNKKKKKKAADASENPFDALKEVQEDNATNSDQEKQKRQSTNVQSSIPKTKNKNKKKGKAVAKSVEDMSIEEFEKSLEQMNKQLGSATSGAGSSQQPAVTPLKQLLAVDTRFLDADAEMKKMFGARVVNSEIKDRRYAKVAKRSLLAQPRNTWPVRKASGLSMEIVDTDQKENVTTFKIVHSEYYQKTQLKFLAAVASYDPNNLVALLRESPFHIDSLLQLSEVSRHNGDNALAGEFIEQALFAFEKSFHSLFNIASGSVRLSFMEVENRSFFLALHRHIQFLGRRGCWRTAFEFNKLLLSLDPVYDELGSLLSIDFYSLKAHEYTYMVKLYERLKEDHGLDRMPNFLYSIAMAHFHMESAQGDTTHQQSSEMLQRSIIMFPTAVLLLADQGNFSVDAETAGEPAFYPAQDLPKVLDLYINLFVLRNHALWKEPEVISWLKSNIKVCVQSRFKNQNDPDVKDAEVLLSKYKTAATKTKAPLSYSFDGTLESDAPEFSALQQSSSSPSNPYAISLRVCRHVLVSEYNALARFLPQEIVTATSHMYDPLPPPGSRNVYEERFEAQRRSGGLMGGARDAAQSVLEEVVRRLRAGGLPDLRGNNAGAGGEAGELQEAQLRQIADAVQMLRARIGTHAQPDGALPGAFPGQTPPLEATAATPDTAVDDAATASTATAEDAQENASGPHDRAGDNMAERAAGDLAENVSVLQSLTEVMRLLGFGPRGQATGGENITNTEMPPLTHQETQELVNSMLGGLESGDEEYYTDDDEDEDRAFGSDGNDGWEPYDPAAYE